LTSPAHAAPPAHVVVLAAGRGSRLGDLGDGTPKWLLDVGGRTIADRQLEGVAEAGAAVGSVRVVVGHAADAIEAALAERPEPIGVVPNPEFAEINNWWSLLRALRVLPEDGPVVVINADLLVDPTAVSSFISAVVEGEDEALLAVDLERQLTDESMKVTRGDGGFLERIGKVQIVDPVGEYVGMLGARGGALRRMREVLESFVGRSERDNEWYEGAVGRTAAEGLPWRIWPMPSSAWVEIDDDADLRAAQALVGSA
jgi:choline kinase